jgi:Ca-activated chloride channel homolog
MTDVLSQLAHLFARPWMLGLAFAAAAFMAVVEWRSDVRRRARLAQLGDTVVLERLVPTRARGLPPRLRAVILGIAALCLGVGIAGPRWGERPERRRDTGVDIALVLDVSASMLAADEAPSRLERMKGDVHRLLATMPGSRVALLVVAGRSYILTPLTPDHDALGLFLDGLDPGMVSQGGTSLAQGIRQATQLLGASSSGDDHALVVMSDGETWDEESELATAAQEAKEARVAVVTVGYGTSAGATIPIGSGGVKKDLDGQTVVTRAIPATLEGIARLADGVFVDGISADRPGRVRAALRRLRQTERVSNAGASPIQRYALFVWPAFLLLLFDALVAERVVRFGRRSVLSAAAVIFAVLVPATDAKPQARGDSPDPMALFQQRRYVDAAEALRTQIARGDRSLRTMYNLGTALLEADSIGPATEMLERVVTIAPDAELRFRSLFNLGLANLRRARSASGPDAGPYFTAAVAAYKRALRTRAGDADAKWNLELALREQQNAGGGGSGASGGGGSTPPPSPPNPAQKDLDRQRAAAVLSSAARDERDVQAKRQRDGRQREASAGRDW